MSTFKLNINETRAWNYSAATYVLAQNIVVVENCFAFQFTNLGDTIARVNGMIIYPSATPGSSLGDSRSMGGHVMDLYKGIIALSFQQPVGAAPLVEIVQLYYVFPYRNPSEDRG